MVRIEMARALWGRRFLSLITHLCDVLHCNRSVLAIAPTAVQLSLSLDGVTAIDPYKGNMANAYTNTRASASIHLTLAHMRTFSFPLTKVALEECGLQDGPVGDTAVGNLLFANSVGIAHPDRRSKDRTRREQHRLSSALGYIHFRCIVLVIELVLSPFRRSDGGKVHHSVDASFLGDLQSLLILLVNVDHHWGEQIQRRDSFECFPERGLISQITLDDFAVLLQLFILGRIANDQAHVLSLCLQNLGSFD
jgi:hypothetical protein